MSTCPWLGSRRGCCRDVHRCVDTLSEAAKRVIKVNVDSNVICNEFVPESKKTANPSEVTCFYCKEIQNA